MAARPVPGGSARPLWRVPHPAQRRGCPAAGPAHDRWGDPRLRGPQPAGQGPRRTRLDQGRPDHLPQARHQRPGLGVQRDVPGAAPQHPVPAPGRPPRHGHLPARRAAAGAAQDRRRGRGRTRGQRRSRASGLSECLRRLPRCGRGGRAARGGRNEWQHNPAPGGFPQPAAGYR
ncbi:hypothetical protein D3C81_1586870 [compost metagenome]